MKCLVVGLESSCTKIVAKTIAYNLGIIDSPDAWDGHEEIMSDTDLVCHRSLPHHNRDNFINHEFSRNFDVTIVVTRDWNCSLISKNNTHTSYWDAAINEHRQGIDSLKDIVGSGTNVHIFSSETAYLLQEAYTLKFLKEIGILDPVHVKFENVNEKYLVMSYG